MDTKESFGVNLSRLDLNLLKVFLTLMRLKSVTKTAEQLCRTQSAISHSLARLREYFKDDLFNRDSGSMEPTARAFELARVIEQAFSDINGVIGHHHSFDPATSRRNFKIGISDYVAIVIVPDLIKKFRIQAPNATLNIINMHEAQSSQLIKDGIIEYAITPYTGLADVRLEKIELSRDKLLCMAWKHNPAIKNGITLSSYLQADHLQISADGTSPGYAYRALHSQKLERRVVATTPHYLVAPAIIRNSNLITILGDSILFTLNDDSELAIMNPPFELPSLDICLVFNPVKQHDDGHFWIKSLIIDIWNAKQAVKPELFERYVI
ncbi:PCP degradation transcriptional activation protein [Pseudomonas fluorescens]|uniref:LysR family transcriptional regulator n=1 Tax=Pseudomonas fluorescens TaxID=294 RepID=UPI00125A12A5|nr:LysR family transcriptional regulator [Pseudomonas fluorescens]VVO54050.1 PCP degradation transcriptional activation protein [Pseudomonas fluorescens]